MFVVVGRSTLPCHSSLSTAAPPAQLKSTQAAPAQGTSNAVARQHEARGAHSRATLQTQRPDPAEVAQASRGGAPHSGCRRPGRKRECEYAIRGEYRAECRETVEDRRVCEPLPAMLVCECGSSRLERRERKGAPQNRASLVRNILAARPVWMCENNRRYHRQVKAWLGCSMVSAHSATDSVRN